MKANNTS